ncbi:hypothetical protein [Botryobacter ruber]|uniref:hypothetical protein n=1 Tax=Botryobacter ruber TaxID=2171629 RepID=UPI000E0B4819|nr:hypothetical protein [Botryobacter ruber]
MEKGNVNQIIAGIFVIALIVGFCFPVIYIGYSGQEARSKFFIALDQGALFWGALTAALSILLFKCAKAGKVLKSSIIFFSMSMSGLLFYMALDDLKPAHTDIAIYENDRSENLIIQYFETGVTGNPQSRLIKTSNMNSSIREFDEVQNAAFLDSLQLGYYHYIKERIPRTYLVKDDTFYLKKIHRRYNRRQPHL